MVDVVVVGAGLSGLVCARRLAEAGRTVRLLEARDRVGGRTLSRSYGGSTFDLGGQWIGPGQPRVVALAQELGVDTFPTYDKGRRVIVGRDGTKRTYRSSVPRLSLVGFVGLARAFLRIELDGRRLPRASPWSSSLAADWDSRSAEELVASLPVDARDALSMTIRTLFGAEPEELSLLWVLHYIRAGGGLLDLVGIKGGAQERRFVHGAQSLSTRLADRLGDAVVLDAAVRRISQAPREVTVETRTSTISARLVVCAVPPGLSARITFEPSLPSARAVAMERMRMGGLVKILALYERPFWRHANLSGEVVFSTGPLNVVFDNGSSDDRQAALVGFVSGESARRFHEVDPQVRSTEILGALAGALGPLALSPTAYVEHDWTTEEWSSGCPVANGGPGELMTIGPALRPPCGRIHWAGTETASESPGYLEGAIAAGTRAAGEVLARL
jgi:monoamine oxidase